MYNLFHMLSAQADAGSAQLSHQNEGDSGKEQEEGLQKFGSEFIAEKDSVYYQVTIPCQLSFGKILVEDNLNGNVKFFPEQGKHMQHESRLVIDVPPELSA